MSVALLKCGQCSREYCIEDKLFADTCGHLKCRECILVASDTSCNQCVMVNAGAGHAIAVNAKSPLKTKKESKVSNQTHIIEQLSAMGTIQYHCTACGKTFRSRSQKYYHLQCSQLNEALYECSICKKTFARHSQFKYHNESHASPINECPKCQKIFSNPLALKKHEALHNVEPKPCTYCDKTFLKKISLEQHIASQHLHQLQYGCAYCNKKYASKSTLQLHLQSHEKKRFECSFCGKLFQRNSILNLHLKRHNHNTDSTHKCKMCDKIFSESGALARHRKIHEENTVQYHCKLCDKNILRKDNMTRHVNTIHPEEKFDDIILIINPLSENVNERASENCKKHPMKDDNSNQIEQADFEPSYDMSAGLENKAFANDFETVCLRRQIKSQNNIVIIENRVLQKPKEIQPSQSAFEDGKNCGIDDPAKVNCNNTFVANCVNTDFKEDIHIKSTVTQVEVITPHSNIDKNTDYNLPQNRFVKTVINNATLHSKEDKQQIEYDTSLLLKLEQNILFSNSLTISPSEDNMLSGHISNTQPNSFCEQQQQQHFKSGNTDSNLCIVSNNFEPPKSSISSMASITCQSIDQATTHNKASVIRSIGNVKKILSLTPSSPTESKSIVPNNVLLDCEYKHKKYSRHYNVDLYRKILGCDDDEDDSEEYQHHCNHPTEKQDNSCDATTATPVHWRKSFKNNYETSTL